MPKLLGNLPSGGPLAFRHYGGMSESQFRLFLKNFETCWIGSRETGNLLFGQVFGSESVSGKTLAMPRSLCFRNTCKGDRLFAVQLNLQNASQGGERGRSQMACFQTL